MVAIDDILRTALDREASDVHLKVGAPPFLRRFGQLGPEESFGALSAEDLLDVIKEMTDEKQRERLDADRQLDLGYGNDRVGRFRVNVYHQRGELRVAMRAIPRSIRSLDQLQLPKIVETLGKESRGLILVTGTTGSGKSTTLASMIDLLNQSEALHMITVEDPIEYEHNDKLSIISQREVGIDVASFAAGLKGALRQDPDVILVGEMRDLETISVALTAAETGHLVFATLHTQDTPQTIDRIVDVFESAQQGQIRAQLSNILMAICSQRLIPSIGGGRIAAAEILIATPAVRNIIREGKTHQLDAVIQTGAEFGMQSMDKQLVTLIHAGTISYDEARNFAVDIDELDRLMRD